MGATVLLSSVPSARAEELATSRLHYVVDRSSTASCPDEESFRHQVAARLGYEPFVADGKHRVSVSLKIDRGRVRGRAEVLRRGQTDPGIRELDGEPDKCESLVAALATAVAIALDPARSTSPLPPPSEPTLPGPAIVQQEPSETPADNAELLWRRVKPFGSLDGIVSLGLTPGVALGGKLGFGFRVRAFSLEASGAVETMPAATHVDSGDRLEATIFSGRLAPCAHWGGAFGCLTGRVGVFQGRAPDVASPTLANSVFGAMGLRAGTLLPINSVLSLRAAGIVEVPFVRTSLIVDKIAVWTAPPMVGGIELGGVVFFP